MVSGNFITDLLFLTYIQRYIGALSNGSEVGIMDNVAVKRPMDVTLKRRFDITLTDTNVVTFTAVAIFLPYVLTTILLLFLSVYILANKYARQQAFIHSGTGPMKIFFAYVLAVPFLYRNWKGLAVGAALILGLVLGLYLRSMMTKELYERILRLVCGLSITSAGYAIMEALYQYIYDGKNIGRISSVFNNPNYFGTIAATVIIICAYKIFTSSESKWLYYVAAGTNIISIYLSKSMFAWVEVFVGVTVLLALLHKRFLLTLWIMAACLGAYLIFYVGLPLIPRLDDVGMTLRLRRQIWGLAIDQIKADPWFGHGFLSFEYLFGISYKNRMIPHAHNYLIDLLLNFGVVGAILFLWYFIRYYQQAIKTRIRNPRETATALILAVTAAALAHGTADLTLLWIQTLPLFLFIQSGLGPELKLIN